MILLLLFLFLLIVFLLLIFLLLFLPLVLSFNPGLTVIRVILPYHLRTLAQVGGEVEIDVPPPVTQRALLDALEARYPALRGTIRDHGSDKRRPMLRFFACQEDLSNESPDTPLPEAVVSGKEAFWIVGAIAGG